MHGVRRRGVAGASALVALVALTVALGGCSVASPSGSSAGSSNGASAGGPVELHVLAASSLRTVLESISPTFESSNSVKVVAVYASSGALQRQIEAGAPADVFLSASPSQVASLAVDALVSAEDSATFAGNDLAILVPSGNPGGIHAPADLARAARLTTGDPKVAPHGAKAREWLVGLGIWETLKPKMVFAQNAAQTDGYVARSEVDAAIGFASDAHGRTDIQVAYLVPSGQYKPATYVVVPVKASTHPDLAKEFVKYLLSPEVQGELVRAGFRPGVGK